MRNAWCLLVLGGLLMTGCATFQAGAPQGMIDVIAHRGASAYAPENTLASFRLAHEMQADWFELDCTLSKDDEVIVIHDDSVDRTTDAEGAVRDMDLAELKKLDAGSWKEARFAGERLPTLGEALDCAKGKIGVYIEIKNSDDDRGLEAAILNLAADRPAMDRELRADVREHIEASGTRNLELTREVIRLVRDRRMRNQVVIQSFSPIVCAVALMEAPELRTELLGSDKKEEPERWETFLRWGYLLDVAGFNTAHTALDPGRLGAFHRARKSVAVWTVDDEQDMRRYATWGVDGIITNRPDACLAVLKQMGKH